MSQRRRGRGRHRRHPGQGGEGAEAEVDETGEEFVPFNADIPMPFQSAAANGEEAEGDEANPGPFPCESIPWLTCPQSFALSVIAWRWASADDLKLWPTPQLSRSPSPASTRWR